MLPIRSILLFLAAAVCEIGGAWLIWQSVRENRGWLFAVLGVIALGGYGFKIDPEPASGVRVTKHVGPIQGDSILARAEWDRAEDGGGRINVAPTLAYAQQVLVPDLDSDSDEAGEWHPLGDLVNAISSQVVLHVGKLYNADRVDRGLPQDQLT